MTIMSYNVLEYFQYFYFMSFSSNLRELFTDKSPLQPTVWDGGYLDTSEVTSSETDWLDCGKLILAARIARF